MDINREQWSHCIASGYNGEEKWCIILKQFVCGQNYAEVQNFIAENFNGNGESIHFVFYFQHQGNDRTSFLAGPI